MRYFLAIVMPPLAVIACEKYFQFLLSIVLTLCFWIPGVIHALLVVSTKKADERQHNLIRALRESNAVQARLSAPLPLPRTAPNVPTRLSGGKVALIGVGVIGFIVVALNIATRSLTHSAGGEMKAPAPPAVAVKKDAIVPSAAAPDAPQMAPEKITKTIYDEREWTSADGVRSFAGALRTIGDGEVTIEREDGPITFAVGMLSAADKEFIGQGISITTSDGRRHEGGSIVEIVEDSILFKMESGPVRLEMANLPKELRERLGCDTALAEANRKAAETNALSESETLNGLWILEDAKSGGISGVDRSPSNQSWEIQGERITINTNRTLWLRHDTTANPRRLFIEYRRGGNVVPVYACIYRMEGDRLIVCFDAGDSPPSEFRAEEADFTFLLKFQRDQSF
jgi:uncharacterized protein (TIGR03067 family)